MEPPYIRQPATLQLLMRSSLFSFCQQQPGGIATPAFSLSLVGGVTVCVCVSEFAAAFGALRHSRTKKKTPAQTKQGLVAPLFGVRADLSNASGDANLQFALMKQKY